MGSDPTLAVRRSSLWTANADVRRASASAVRHRAMAAVCIGRSLPRQWTRPYSRLFIYLFWIKTQKKQKPSMHKKKKASMLTGIG
jgi:hypothetical protein